MGNTVSKTNRFGANKITICIWGEAMTGGTTAHTTAAHAVDNP